MCKIIQVDIYTNKLEKTVNPYLKKEYILSCINYIGICINIIVQCPAEWKYCALNLFGL